MARKWRQDSNVDPFNAGDPVMPGEDDKAWHSGDECDLDEGSYEAPIKGTAGKAKHRGRKADAAQQGSVVQPAPVSSMQGSPTGASDSSQKKRSNKVLKGAIIAIITISLASCIMGLVASCVEGIFDAIYYDSYYDDYDYDYDDDYNYDDDDDYYDYDYDAEPDQDWLDWLDDLDQRYEESTNPKQHA